MRVVLIVAGMGIVSLERRGDPALPILRRVLREPMPSPASREEWPDACWITGKLNSRGYPARLGFATKIGLIEVFLLTGTGMPTSHPV